MQQRTVRTGVALHARPLDGFVRRARAVSGVVRLRYGDKESDGRDVVKLLLLAVPQGAEVTVTVDGPAEQEEVETLAELLVVTPPAPEQANVAAAPSLAGVVAGAPGRGVGRVHRPGRAASRHARGTVAQELQRLSRATQAVRSATERLIRRDDPFSDIFAVQLTILDDPSLAEIIRAGVVAGRGVEKALEAAFSELAVRFRSLSSTFAAERHADLADIHERLLAALGQGEAETALGGEGRVVLLLEEATPSRLALLDTDRVAAVISEHGGPSSHAAVVARGRGLPLVYVPAPELSKISEGELALVDGTRGQVRMLGPDEAAQEAARSQSCGAAPASPALTTTADGVRVILRANLGAPGDLAAALATGAEGCGLLRSELLFAGRARAPSVEEHARAYARIARTMAPNPVVVRLFDAGSDKPLAFLPAPEREPNPALGCRGVRLLLEHRQVLADQLLGIVEARRQSGCELRAMVPMIIDSDELEHVRELCPPELPLGAMVETPAAALLCGELAGHAAFLSVGTNDLAQYVTARDRQRGGASLHPAVLRLLAEVARQTEHAGIECAVCGELAGDPQIAPLLVGLGFRCLSLAPARLAEVRRAIGAHPLTELVALSRSALSHVNSVALTAWLAARPGDDP